MSEFRAGIDKLDAIADSEDDEMNTDGGHVKAGFNPVFIETVGVGQSEIEVDYMSDIFILVLQPGSGDELQGIKRGIMEMADIIIINKNDNENLITAKNTFNHYNSATKLLKSKIPDWERKVLLVSAIENNGIEQLWDEILLLESIIEKNGFKKEKRQKQKIKWFEQDFLSNLTKFIHDNPKHIMELESLKQKIIQNSLSPIEASEFLLNKFIKNLM